MAEIKYDEAKFKELLLYVAGKCEHDPKFGAVKLNKILFLADFITYAETGTPISGAEYIALELGPAPKFMKPVRDAMESDKELVVRQKRRFTYTQDQVIPLREPDLRQFTGEEIALVDAMVDLCAEDSGKDLTELTHAMLGWKMAQYKEAIPYSTIFLCGQPPTQADKERARELAAKYEW